ncbi:MAG: capsular biosynthesis protein [Muribaculaceae bacterium]|nr:capsular biosynthesis protein [Muribaculaceae bacterium]
MWLFSKKSQSLEKSGLMKGLTDWHSHILPGVDDGIRTRDAALEVLRAYEDLGVQKIWLTPHIMEDFPNETGKLRERYEELKSAYKGNIELKLAAENMLDTLFEERLEKGDLLPIGEDGRCLLVETSYYNPPINFDELIERVFSAGYFPLLAHPERYRYMSESDYKRLKDRGVLFQVNFMSLAGAYGETAQKKGEWLLKEGMLDAVGSDVHKLSMIQRYMKESLRRQEHLDRLLAVASDPKVDKV